MANRYVWSGAAGAGTGADWANAHTTLSAAITAGAIGDVYYVAHDHSGLYGATTTLTFKGTSTSPDRVICVNRAGSVPPVAADIMQGGVEGTNAATTNLTINGSAYFDSMTFRMGSGQSTTCTLSLGNGSFAQNYRNCSFQLATTGASSRISLGATTARMSYVDCKVKFAATGQSYLLNGGIHLWQGPSGASLLETGSTVPTSLVINQNNTSFKFSGVDLSDVNTTLMSSGSVPTAFELSYCKLHASVTIVATPSGSAGPRTIVNFCKNTTGKPRDEIYLYQGTVTTETTIVRTGGASDGTTPFSHKIVSNANNERDFPIIAFEGEIWNDDTGSAKTLTVHCVTDNVTLKDDEISVEAEYLGSSGSPITTLISDAPATVLTAGVNQATSAETWTTTGLTTPVYQKLEVTFTPQMKGLVRYRVKVGKVSTTVYVCPKAELS